MRKYLDNFVFGNGYQFKQDAPNELNYQQLAKALQQREELANRFLQMGSKDYGSTPVSGWAHAADALTTALGMYMKTAGMRKSGEAEQAAKEQAQFYKDQLAKQQSPEEIVEAANTFYPERDLSQENLFTYKDPAKDVDGFMDWMRQQPAPAAAPVPAAPAAARAAAFAAARAAAPVPAAPSTLPANVGRSVNRAEGGNYMTLGQALDKAKADYSKAWDDLYNSMDLGSRQRAKDPAKWADLRANRERALAEARARRDELQAKWEKSLTEEQIAGVTPIPGIDTPKDTPKKASAQPASTAPAAVAQTPPVQEPPVQEPPVQEPPRQLGLEDVVQMDTEKAKQLLQGDAQSRSNFVRDALRRQELERQQAYAALEGNPYAQSLMRQRLRDEGMNEAVALYEAKKQIDARYKGGEEPAILSNAQIRVDPQTGMEYFLKTGPGGRVQRVDTGNVNQEWQAKTNEKSKTDQATIERSGKAIQLADQFMAMGGGEEAGAGPLNAGGAFIAGTGLWGTKTGDARAKYAQLYSAASSFLIDEMNALGIPVSKLLDGDREAMRQIASKLSHPDDAKKMSPKALNDAVMNFRNEALALVRRVQNRVNSENGGQGAAPATINGVPRYQGRGQTIRPAQ